VQVVYPLFSIGRYNSVSSTDIGFMQEELYKKLCSDLRRGMYNIDYSLRLLQLTPIIEVKPE
jgi:hypothetical protein